LTHNFSSLGFSLKLTGNLRVKFLLTTDSGYTKDAGATLGIYGVRYVRAVGYFLMSECATRPARENRV